mgnify:CR=1 FL=1
MARTMCVSSTVYSGTTMEDMAALAGLVRFVFW